MQGPVEELCASFITEVTHVDAVVLCLRVRWRDPEQLQQWIGELSKSEPVVVYCAYGFHVGCKTAIKLREAGFDAKYMNSGHSGWRAIGHPVLMNP